MKITNEAAKPPIGNLGGLLHIQCAAKAEAVENGPPLLKFQGYSGDSVTLKDYGFDAPVVYDINSMDITKTIPILYNHNESVGHTTNVRKVDNNSAVRGKGMASLPGPSTTKIVEGIKNGYPWQASMGLRFNNPEKDFTYIPKGTVNVNNREFKAPIYVAHNSVLHEMTVTEFGRDSDTSFVMNKDTLMKIKNSATPPVVEGSAGNPTPTPTPTPTPANPVAPPVVQNKEPSKTLNVTAEQLTEIINKVISNPVTHNKDEKPANTDLVKVDNGITLRYLKLSRKFQGHEDLILEGLEKGYDDTGIENSIKLQNMDNDLYKPPSPEIRKERHQRDLIRMSLGFGVTPEHLATKFDKKEVDRVYDENRPASLVELLVQVANSQGGRFTGHSDVEELCKFVKNTGYSTFDLPRFFSKVTDFVQEERWKIAKPIAPQICKKGSNRNFNKNRRFRMFGGQVWNEVAADGKIDLWTAGDEKYYDTNLKTHAALFTFTRQDAINDDMGHLQDLMDIMVESASMMPDIELGRYLLVEDESASNGFWVEAVNSIYGRAFNRTNLETTWNAMRTYSEPKEDFNWTQMIDDTWRIIHGPSLDIAIFDIFKQSVIVGNTTANTIQGQQNFWFNKMDPLTFPQIANTSVFPGTLPFVNAGTWILWPKSVQFAPFEITYLRGKETPTIEPIDMPGEVLGFGVRGYWDFKINKRDATTIRRITPAADPD